VRLPTKNWKAQVWDKEKLDFAPLEADVLEQTRYNKNYTLETEFELFVPMLVEPGEVGILKLNEEFLTKEDKIIQDDKKDSDAKNSTDQAFVGQETSLSIEGFSPDGEVILLYNNKAQQIS